MKCGSIKSEVAQIKKALDKAGIAAEVSEGTSLEGRSGIAISPASADIADVIAAMGRPDEDLRGARSYTFVYEDCFGVSVFRPGADEDFEQPVF
jgi:hypothetical protein